MSKARGLRLVFWSGVRIRMLNYITVEAIAQFPIPNSRFPIPDSQFPIPNSRFPIPDSQFPIPNSPCLISYTPYFPVVVSRLCNEILQNDVKAA